MKILLVNTHHFYGGGDRAYTFNLANLLRWNFAWKYYEFAEKGLLQFNG